MYTKLYPLLAITLLLISCKKDSNSSDVLLKKDRIDLLINKKWQMTSDFYYQKSDNGSEIKNENYGGTQYRIDDYVIYHPDFTMEWNDSTLLDPDDPNAVYTGTWQISDDGKTLTTQLLSPRLLPAYSTEILSVTDAEYKTTDIRVTPDNISLKYFTTYTAIP